VCSGGAHNWSEYLSSRGIDEKNWSYSRRFSTSVTKRNFLLFKSNNTEARSRLWPESSQDVDGCNLVDVLGLEPDDYVEADTQWLLPL
jgi:hypothetical protein